MRLTGISINDAYRIIDHNIDIMISNLNLINENKTLICEKTDILILKFDILSTISDLIEKIVLSDKTINNYKIIYDSYQKLSNMFKDLVDMINIKNVFDIEATMLKPEEIIGLD